MLYPAVVVLYSLHSRSPTLSDGTKDDRKWQRFNLVTEYSHSAQVYRTAVRGEIPRRTHSRIRSKFVQQEPFQRRTHTVRGSSTSTHGTGASQLQLKFEYHRRLLHVGTVVYLEACRSRVNVFDDVAIEIVMESLCHVTSAVETRTRIRLHTTSATPMGAAVAGTHSMSTQCQTNRLKYSQSRDSFRFLESWNHIAL